MQAAHDTVGGFNPLQYLPSAPLGARRLITWWGPSGGRLWRLVRVAEAFVKNVELEHEKKIVTLSSTMGSIQEMPYPVFLYPTSKTALNKAISILAVALRDRGIIAALFCPGHVKTDLGGEGASVEVEDSVAGLRQLFPDSPWTTPVPIRAITA